MISHAPASPDPVAPSAQRDTRHADLVLVLGMHRSGTSCLAGALEICGLRLGEVRRTGRHNAKGYFERHDIVQINDRILGLNGGSWLVTPSRIRLHPFLREQIVVAVRAMTADGHCGLKDPRLLPVLDAWIEAAPANLRFVGTFRHPLAVAASLKARNGMPIEQGLALWLDYNSRLAARHREAPFPLLRYDISPTGPYLRAVVAAATALGLRPAPLRMWRFVSRRLDHQGAARSADVPADCASLYSYLCENSLNPLTRLPA